MKRWAMVTAVLAVSVAVAFPGLLIYRGPSAPLTPSAAPSPASALSRTVPLPPDRYLATFTETGLPDGTTWSVLFNGTLCLACSPPSFNGMIVSANTPSLSFELANGSYPFLVGVPGPVPYNTTISQSSPLYVQGASVGIHVTFRARCCVSTLLPPSGPPYLVTVTESGLLRGVLWSAGFNGSNLFANAVSFSYMVGNGTYRYAIEAPGWQPSPGSGRIAVNGTDMKQTVTFTRVTHPVTFTESGLPAGTSWSVSLNETTQSTVSSTIAFEEPNGTYPVYTWDVKGYMSYTNVTTLHVSGAPIDITVYYDPPAAGTYYVTFVQTGLPLNVYWKVQLSAIINGTTAPGYYGQNSPGPTHTPAGISGVLNGTFAWTAFHPSVPEWPIPSYYPFPSSGTVVVNGSSVLIHLTYRYSYPFYFDVEGLPASGVLVTLQVPNETVTGSGSGLYLLMIPNGTYVWNATAPGYGAQNGTVMVRGGQGSNIQEIYFQALPQTSTFPEWAWGALGVVTASAVVGPILLIRRRRRDRVSPPPPPNT